MEDDFSEEVGYSGFEWRCEHLVFDANERHANWENTVNTKEDIIVHQPYFLHYNVDTIKLGIQ